MKRFAIALLIAIIIPTCVFAGRGLLDLTVGAVASSNYKVSDVQTLFSDIPNGSLKEFKFDRLSWGADVELKLAFAAADAKIMYNPETKAFSGKASLGLAIDILFVRAKAGLAYNYAFNVDNPKDSMRLGNSNLSLVKFSDWKKAALDINVGVDVLLGDLTIGAYASLPTATSIENNEWAKLVDSAFKNWKDAEIGLVFGYAVF